MSQVALPHTSGKPQISPGRFNSACAIPTKPFIFTDIVYVQRTQFAY